VTAATVAQLLTQDPPTQEAIVGLLERNGFDGRELHAVLVVTEAFLEGVQVAGGCRADHLMRAGATAVDSVWSLRRAVAR
jgi:hypothetical protein